MVRKAVRLLSLILFILLLGAPHPIDLMASVALEAPPKEESDPDADSSKSPENPQTPPESKDKTMDKKTKEIFHNDESLFAYVKQYGLQQSIKRLNELTPLYGDCHHPAHKAGRFAYSIFSNLVFSSWGPECHSGGLHGSIEAYFKKNGTRHLSRDVKIICPKELNSFFYHQCIHGIGHGLTAWIEYDLIEALKSCDLLDQGQDSCWSGVFMENIVGGLADHEGHGTHESPPKKSSYLSEDPHYPCSFVPDRYKSSCYFLQTSRMMQLFNGNFSKIASACASAPTPYQPVCYESMGRDVSGIHRNNPSEVKAGCSTAQPGFPRRHCFKGAIQDTFWDAEGQETALKLCRSFKGSSEKSDCYDIIFERAMVILNSKKDLEAFCAKPEKAYQQTCRLRVVR